MGSIRQLLVLKKATWNVHPLRLILIRLLHLKSDERGVMVTVFASPACSLSLSRSVSMRKDLVYSVWLQIYSAMPGSNDSQAGILLAKWVSPTSLLLRRLSRSDCVSFRLQMGLWHLSAICLSIPILLIELSLTTSIFPAHFPLWRHTCAI